MRAANLHTLDVGGNSWTLRTSADDCAVLTALPHVESLQLSYAVTPEMWDDELYDELYNADAYGQSFRIIV